MAEPGTAERDGTAAEMPVRDLEIDGGDSQSATPMAIPTAEIQRPGQLIRIAAMVRELLGEVRQSSPDEAGRQRLRQVYERALAELREGLSAPLQQELDTLTIPLEGTPSESEIRLAQAQLVGWLEGLFQGIQAAVWAQHAQAQAQLEEMRRRGLSPSPNNDDGRRRGDPGQYL
jgi:hypothetical protein